MSNHCCKQCGQSYALEPDDHSYLERISPVFAKRRFTIPLPTLCPDCRHQRRLSWRNERALYRTKCSISEKDIISVYSPDGGYKVCHYDHWWTDEFDPLAYGREVDFSRPFIEQFSKLLYDVPHMALIGSQNENCPYCHLLANCKNCYMIVESSNNEDCLYGYWLQKCLGCVETSYSHECQYCYEVDNCYNCYNLRYSKDCTNCFDSSFLENCIGCKNCFGCINLTQKDYCIENKQVSRKEYEDFIASIALSNFSEVRTLREKYTTLFLTFPRKYSHMLRSEDCSGDYVMTSRDCTHCFHAHDAEHCKYGEHVWRNSKNNRDVSTAGRDAEFIYEAINTGISSYNVSFAVQCWSCSDLHYCYGCFDSHDCFGSVGLKRSNYCILNKEYSKEDYEKLAAKTVELMISTGEWGEFFPVSRSPFCYNETVAHEQFPLTSKQAQALGFRFKERDPREYRRASTELSESIQHTPDSLTNETLACAECEKNYRIVTEELRFYKRFGIPVPRLCPDCRHLSRMRGRNSNKLWDRACAECKKDILTSYAPERPERVLCEECFLKEVY